MKQLFKTFFIFLLILVSSFITNTTETLAKTFPTQKVDSHKSWTIKFNDSIDPYNVLSNITIENSKGELIPCTKFTIYSSNSISLSPPDNSYEPGEYTLKISDKVKSCTGKKLKEACTMKFIVVNSSSDKKIYYINNFDELLNAVEKRTTNFKILDEKVKEVYDKANTIINNVTFPNMTDYEKEKALHDYIVKNTAYDYDNYRNHTIPKDSYCPYGILIKNTGVCQGYAETMKLLLNMVNIECKVIHGEANNGGHAWNKVKIDEKEYNLDATWDDPVPDNGPNYVRYDYFNISDEELSKDHDWNVDVTINDQNQKIKYSTYKFYKENKIKFGSTKKINVNISLPNGEKAPKGGAYILVSLEQFDNDYIHKNLPYEKDCYIPEGENSFNFSMDVPLNKHGYIIRYWLDFEEKKPNYNYVPDGYYSNTKDLPKIIDGNNSIPYDANIVIPKANLIKGKFSLANGEVAPEDGVKITIFLVPYNCLPMLQHSNGSVIIANSKEDLIIPKGKNSIEYDLPASINNSGYYLEYQTDNNAGYFEYLRKYKKDGINVTRLCVDKKDAEANITLFKEK